MPGEHSAQAEALLERDSEWAARVLWRSEFRNILAGHLRRKALRFDQVLAIQSEAERLMAGAEFDVASTSVLELARDSGCSAYDCEFVALAIDLRTLLVTMDRELLRAFPTRAAGCARRAA